MGNFLTFGGKQQSTPKYSVFMSSSLFLGGYPPSQITWFHEISNDSNLQVQHIEYEQDTQSHLVSVRRTIIYTASILDHNSTISCRIVQTRLQPHSIIYTRYKNNI